MFALVIAALPVQARQAGVPTSWVRPVPGIKQVADLETPPVSPGLFAKAAGTREAGVPTQFAEPFELLVTPDTDGSWEIFANGDALWRLVVRSPGATDLNFGFTLFHLPEGATLHVYSTSANYYQGPYTAADNKPHRSLWCPVLPGPEAVIELFVPATAASMPELALSYIGRGYRDLFHLGHEPEAGPEQGFCNNDVICPEADDWRDEIRSVAMYSVAGKYLCTGTLVNNLRQDFRNYFLTANHCGITRLNDDSVVVYWNFESPACGDLGGGSLSHNQSGAILRAHRAGVDFTLVELEDTPAASFDVYYAGWDASGSAPTSSVCIHHPRGDEKAITFDDDPATVANSCIGLGHLTHWRIGQWDDGTTEPGSSGSGLFDATSHALIGTLSGGLASCFNTGGYDCFGRFSEAWDAGLPAGHRLDQWLDPEGTGLKSVAGSDPMGPSPVAYTDWISIYSYLLKDVSELKTLREYRDRILSQFAEGRAYRALAYARSDDILHVFALHPRLVVRARDLLQRNLQAATDALAGRPAVIADAPAVIAFLDAFAAEAPDTLRTPVLGLRERMRRAQQAGELFLGFYLTKPQGR